MGGVVPLTICMECGERPPKKGRRRCGPCQHLREYPSHYVRVRKRAIEQFGSYAAFKRNERARAGKAPRGPMEEIRSRHRAKLEVAAIRRERKRVAREERSALEKTPEYRARLAEQWRNRYRSRYHNDPEFRASERARISARRHRDPIYAAQWEKSGFRWSRAASTHDGSVTRDVIEFVIGQERCSYCMKVMQVHERTIDHVVPISRGGLHVESNVVGCCAPCNRSKSAIPLLAWYQRLTGSSSQGPTTVPATSTFVQRGALKSA